MSWLSGKSNTAPRQTSVLPRIHGSGAVRRPVEARARAPTPAAARVARPGTGLPRKESLIADDLTIEGKIEGGGSVRIAGKFQGRRQRSGRSHHRGRRQADRQRARRQGHDRRRTGRQRRGSLAHRPAGTPASVIGDLKAGSVTVAAGARMRGQGRVRLGRRRRLESRQAPATARRPAPPHEQRASRAAPGQPANVRTAGRRSSKAQASVRPAGITCASITAPRCPRRPRSRRCASKAASGIPPTANLGIHGGRVDPQRSRRRNRP